MKKEEGKGGDGISRTGIKAPVKIALEAIASSLPEIRDIKSGFDTQGFVSSFLEGEDANIDFRRERETPIAKVIVHSNSGGGGSKYKERNEDSVLAVIGDGGKMLRVGVIDGAGGSGGGLEASMIANAVFSRMDTFVPLSRVGESVDQAIRSGAAGGYAAGVVIDIKGSQCTILASGDSRVFTIRDGEVLDEGTSAVQNLAWRQVELGTIKEADYYTHPNKSIITGAMGTGDQAPLIKSFETKFGDQIILGSDGIWDVFSKYELTQLAAIYRGSELETKIFKIAYSRNNSQESFTMYIGPNESIEIPAMYGHGDNISVAVIEYTGQSDDKN